MREKRRELRQSLAVACAVFFSWVTWVLPGPIRRWAINRCGALTYRHSPTYRANVHANLAQVLSLPENHPKVEAAARRVFKISARNFSDLLMVPHKSRKQIIDEVRLTEGRWSHLDDALRLGRGVVIVSSHLGSFDYIGQTLFQRGYPMTAVTARTTARFLFDSVSHLRQAKGMALVEASPSGIRKAIQSIRNGGCAVLATDRDFFQNGRKVEFFGQTTTLPPGAIRIARDTGAAIVPIFAMFSRSGHNIAILPAFNVPKTDDTEADLSAGMAWMARTLEEMIARYPDQWVMFQRVWPSEPVDPVRVFPVGSPLESELLRRVDAALPAPRADRKRRRQEAWPTNRTGSPDRSRRR